MENASKALIIAGAILLSILIISLGIMVYNNAKSTVGRANLDSQTIQAFNSQWESYIGTSRTASEVQAMISAIIASNAAESNSGAARYIVLTPNGAATTATATALPTTTMPNNLSASKTYTITAGYDTQTGLIVGLGYVANSTSGTTPAGS